VFDYLRDMYSFSARFSPGGPLVPCEWYDAPEGALEYPHWHAFGATSQFCQHSNPPEVESNVGELTPAGLVGAGWRKANSLKYKPRVYRPRSSNTIPEGVTGAEWHGSPAAFLCEPEPDGTYSAQYYPDAVPPEVWDALPDCIKARHRACDLLRVGDGGLLRTDEDGGRLEVYCPPSCDLLLAGGGENVLTDEDGGRLEVYCPPSCDLLLAGGGENVLTDEDGGRLEVICPE